MIGARCAGPPGRMQGKAEKDETPYARHRLRCLRLRRHPSTERLAAGKDRQTWRRARGLSDRLAHSVLSYGRRIWATFLREHVGKIEPVGRDPPSLECLCRALHERVVHTGA